MVCEIIQREIKEFGFRLSNFEVRITVLVVRLNIILNLFVALEVSKNKATALAFEVTAHFEFRYTLSVRSARQTPCRRTF